MNDENFISILIFMVVFMAITYFAGRLIQSVYPI